MLCMCVYAVYVCVHCVCVCTLCMCVYTAADRWLYDVNTMQWRDLGMTDDDPPRLWHTATPSDDGEVIIFGGCHGDILSHHEMPVCWLTFVTCVLFCSHTFPGRGQIGVVSTLDDGLRPRSHWCESKYGFPCTG